MKTKTKKPKKGRKKMEAKTAVKPTGGATHPARPKQGGIIGDLDAWRLLCSVDSDILGTQRTQALEVPGFGCIVHVSTVVGGVATGAAAWVPYVKIAPDVNEGNKLVRIESQIEQLPPPASTT